MEEVVDKLSFSGPSRVRRSCDRRKRFHSLLAKRLVFLVGVIAYVVIRGLFDQSTKGIEKAVHRLWFFAGASRRLLAEPRPEEAVVVVFTNNRSLWSRLG
jgi:hypothetical protein